MSVRYVTKKKKKNMLQGNERLTKAIELNSV